MLLSSSFQEGMEEWNPRKDTHAVQSLVSTLLANCSAKSAGASPHAESLHVLCTDLSMRCAGCGSDVTRGEAAAAGIDTGALLQAAESALSQLSKEAEADPFLAASIAHAALLVSMDSEAARSLLEEPWLSYLTASVAAAPEQETTAEPSCHAAIAAHRLAAAAVLVSAARQMEEGFGAYGPGESSIRARARLRTELLVPRCMIAVLSSATATKSGAWAEGAGSNPGFTPDIDVAQHATTLCCRRLVELMTEDLDACATLLQQGALVDLLRTAQAEGGAASAGMAASFAALSASPEFPGALADMPPLQGCALVELAAAEVQRLGPAIAVAGADAASVAAPCFGALLNVCRADAPAMLVHRLADRGIVGLLIDVIRNSDAPKVLRLETADALCRLIPSEDTLEASLPIAALQGIAAPAVVIALVGLCTETEARRSGRGSLGNAGMALQGPCEALRYRLPWLLAGIARIAPTADLKAWTEENTGVRTLLVDGFGSLRSREVQAWCLDILAAFCGRLAPDLFIAFLGRGPKALLDLWALLLDSKAHHVRARAVIVGYYASSCLPLAAAAPGAKSRMEFLSSLPLRGVDSDFWSGPGATGDAGRQLAEVAAAAAAVFAAEATPPGLAWYSRIAVCRVIASGLSAVQLLNVPAGEPHRQRPRAHREAVEVLLTWLQHVLSNFHEVLSDVQKSSSPGAAELPSEAAALLADFLNGPLQSSTSRRENHDREDGQADKDAEEYLFDQASSATSESDTASALRADAARLLEALFFGQELYPGLEDALSVEDGRSRAEKPSLIPATAPVALECAVRSLGEVEYGRWLTRLLIRSFSCESADAAVALNSVEESAKCVRLRPLGAFPCTSSIDATSVPWCPLETTPEAVEVLDALLCGSAGFTKGAYVERKVNLAIGGGRAQLDWIGNLLSKHKRRGLRIVLRFLDRADGAVKTCGADWHLLAAAVLQRIAANRQALGLESLLDVPTAGLALGLAARLLEPLTLTLPCLEEHCKDENLGSNALQSLESCIRLQRATVEGFTIPNILQQDVSLLAEAFTYLWALVHALGASQPLQTLITQSSGMQLASSVCKACVELWHLVMDVVVTLLSEQRVVEALCHSDDNAAVLAPIRQCLGKIIGFMPIFASPSAYQASLDIEGTTSPKHLIDLHTESWCPPGRVLLAALIHLRSLAVCMSSCPEIAFERLLSVTLDAGVWIIEFVARPGNILHSSADVLVLLQEAASIITAPLEGVPEPQQEWQRRAAKLLVTILHRPSIEALLDPETSLEALAGVPNGISALQWCASPDSDVDLGSCGVHARALLLSLDDTSALEEAGVLEEWLQEDVPLELQYITVDEEVSASEQTAVLETEEPFDDMLVSETEPEGAAEISQLAACVSSEGESTQALSEEEAVHTGNGNFSEVQRPGNRFSTATGIATQRYDPEGADALAEASHGLIPDSRSQADWKPSVSSEQQKSEGSSSFSRGEQRSCKIPNPGSRLRMAVGVATEMYDPQACSSKCDAEIGASEAEIDGAQEKQLRAEVCALGDELGSLEAELNAELHELDSEMDAGIEEVYPGRGSENGPDDYEDEIEEEVYSGYGSGNVPTLHVDELLASTNNCGWQAGDALPEEAFEWLRALMAGEAGLASVRDSILGLLVRASQEQRSLSDFEAECLLEIYSHHTVEEVEMLGAGAMRLALRYLYENVPSWSDNPENHVQSTFGANFAKGSSPTGVELDGLFNTDIAVEIDCEDREQEHPSEELVGTDTSVLLESMD